MLYFLRKSVKQKCLLQKTFALGHTMLPLRYFLFILQGERFYSFLYPNELNVALSIFVFVLHEFSCTSVIHNRKMKTLILLFNFPKSHTPFPPVNNILFEKETI